MSTKLFHSGARVVNGAVVNGPPLGNPGEMFLAVEEDGTFSLWIERYGVGQERVAGRPTGSYDVLASGANPNKTGAQNLAAIQAAIDLASAGSTIIVPPGAYTVAGTLNVTKALTFWMYGATLTQATSNTTLFSVSSSNVRFTCGTLTGPQYTVSRSNEIAILAQGASASSYITNVVVEGVTMTNWGQYGVRLKFVENFRVVDCDISNIYFTGVGTSSAQWGRVSRNRIKNIVGSSLAYGIFFSRTELDDLVSAPRSRFITCAENLIEDVTNWEGLDTHGGELISFSRNVVRGCKIGIQIGGSDNSTASSGWAPIHCTADGNIIDDNGNSASSYGIALSGYTGTTGSPIDVALGCVVKGNAIKGYGAANNDLAGAIYMRDTRGSVIEGNTFVEPQMTAINIYHDNYGFSCKGNTVVDVYEATASTAVAVRVRSNYNQGVVAGNTLSRGSHAGGGNYNTHGLHISSSTSNVIEIGPNDFSLATTAPISDQFRKRRTRFTRVISSDKGNADVTWTAGVDEDILRFATTLTANRTVTISGGKLDDYLKVVRTGLGAFTLDVGGIKTIPSATAAYVELQHDGTAFRLIGYGTL